jgi:small subunit ribosomal protein S18
VIGHAPVAEARSSRLAGRRPCEEIDFTERNRMPNSKAKSRPQKKGRPVDHARRRYCSFCKDKLDEVDYKDLATLRRFVSERGKIKSRRISGACRRHQRQVAVAIKRAREMALLPYVAAVSGGGDGGGRRRPR